MQPPVGPLPAAVYWRRRAGAFAAVVVVLVLGVWVVATAGGGADGDADGDGAQFAAGAPPVVAAPSSSPAPSTASPAAPTPPPPTPLAPVLPAAPPPGGCPDAVVGVQAQSAASTFPVGTEPEFRLLVTNTGPVACVVDADASRQEVLVHLADGVTRVWSSNDCYGSGTPDPRSLAPGEQLVFPVAWSGLSSAPGCAGERMPVLGGEFRLAVRFGALVSAPVPFSLT